MKHRSLYPLRLLPNERYKTFDLLKNFGEYYVIRLAPGKDIIRTKEQLDKKFKAAMQAKEFADGVSVVLVSVFRKKDVLYKPDYDLHPEWEDNWDELSSTPRPSEGVSRIPRKSYMGFKLKDLNDVDFEYTPIKGTDSPDMKPINCTIRVEHAPSNINFWHCNLYICEKGTLQDLRNVFDDTLMKRVARMIVPYIKKKALLPSKVKGRKIPKEVYHK